MTAVCERDEELPPLPQNLDTKRVKGEPRIIQKYGDRGTSNYSVKGISNTIPANPMSDRGQLLVEPQSISTKQDKMKENNITVTTCAQRGRETGQRLEAGGEVANALTTVQKDSMVIESATVTTQVDSSHLYFVSEPTTRAAEELRQIAQEHRSCKVGVNIMNDGALRPFNAESRAKDSISEYCTDSSSSSTVIAAREGRVYGPETRYRIRKLTPRECFRLMDVDDEDIDKIQAAGISKTQQYKLAGNSIVVSCLYHIFRTMFIDDQPKDDQPIQLTLFD
jgi:site-specific DNA-cytosine methylase